MQASKSSVSGFSLLEAMVSLAILSIISAPIFTRIGQNQRLEYERTRLIAIGILEQQVALIMLNPDEILPEKRVQKDGREWVINTETTKDNLVQGHTSIYLNGKMLADVAFYCLLDR